MRSHLVVLALLAIVAGVVSPAGVRAQGAPKVVSVSVSGNVHVPTDRIMAVIKTRVGQPFDEATVRQDLAAINDLGFFADQVPPLIRQRPGGVSVTYRVIENPVIQRIAFTGNEHVPSDTLLALMDTAPGQVLNTNTFHQDVLKINSYYDKVGYGGQVPTHVRDLNIDPRTGLLRIDVREGLTVRNVIVKGDTILPPPLIENSLSLKKGMAYSEAARDKDGELIKKLYDKYDLSVGSFEGGIDPSSVDLKNGTADVLYTIDVARVGAVEITGNDITKDIVIRRQLRMRPGMVVTQSGLKRDYERLNNLGFFSKVELNPKPGPNPKRPAEVTLDWNVTEQRTGTAQIGAGYSGGITGTGLTGTLSYSQNNINGTGNGASINLQRGSRLGSASASVSIPYVGNSPRSQKYSFGGTIYTQGQTNLYPVYAVSGALLSQPPVIGTPSPTSSSSPGGTIPVTLIPNQTPVNGLVSNYKTKSSGISLSGGRRLSDYVTASLGISVASLGNDVTVPSPYFVSGSTPGSFINPQQSVFGPSQFGNTLGITASSIANTVNGQNYRLHSVVLGLQDVTLDDIFNPRVGIKTSLSEEVSSHSFGSDFTYTITTLDAAKFYPVLRNATVGLHAVLGATTGAIPANKLFVLSDQQLRGYNAVFYGTEELLLQSELRIPVTSDKHFWVAAFADYGNLRIRGAQPQFDAFGNLVQNYNNWIYHGDAGIGLRFDVPQLGFRSIRLDFARGATGTHTSFGIGQSF
ncbi:MAG: BamA/TamA family outer membrane protein [Candidatus Eremiobacteraeota bacterium]|nr:BamA/TamA family outer membrane protein [Candidatus Eremiobacteraeota bacterium]